MAVFSTTQWLVLRCWLPGLNRWIPAHLLLSPLFILFFGFSTPSLTTLIVVLSIMALQSTLLRDKLRHRLAWILLGSFAMLLGVAIALVQWFLQGVPGGMY